MRATTVIQNKPWDEARSSRLSKLVAADAEVGTVEISSLASTSRNSRKTLTIRGLNWVVMVGKYTNDVYTGYSAIAKCRMIYVESGARIPEEQLQFMLHEHDARKLWRTAARALHNEQ